ncbi:iron-containing alcohol dehydrogenase [Cellvibrio fibrivorans]|jgi:NADP-dependent alcohol dehydrogenase|uniref:NADP-dependent alcohol dehydrogenase n=1 Tax=Cellvibrio fibrivorans TaxID=126350 RepID=A0ABU1UT62_9GAMM|nr:iron-containing alcohol dehydrogenase [Cellvibrio fibrivorans]MDR7088360.1 NADP-dependent alcohol dehydrogenase [Cellvibrio fibrivorans]
MQNFTFSNPTKIVFGEGQIKEIANLVPAGARILVTYGGGSIKKNGVYDQVVKALEGKTWFEFSGIEPNPHYETLMKAVELVKKEKIDFLLPVGGGSVIDGTKLIAAAVNFEGEPWDIMAKHQPFFSALPIGCVLTLPATGTESNGNSVITKAATQEKLSFGSPLVYPQFAILDPTTTYSLPPRQIANGAVDAFVHIMEQYLTYPVDAKVQDRFAEGLLMTLIEEGPRSLKEPTNYAVRANVMWAATMALNGLIGVGVPQDWATHMIGHELTAMHGLDHAQTLAVVLPAVMQHQRDKKRAKLLQYGRRVWNLNHADEDALIDAAIAATKNFFEQMGTPTTLSGYGVGRDSIPKLVDMLVKHELLALGEHGVITPEVSREILELAA